jgi:hypothetical protein
MTNKERKRIQHEESKVDVENIEGLPFICNHTRVYEDSRICTICGLFVNDISLTKLVSEDYRELDVSTLMKVAKAIVLYYEHFDMWDWVNDHRPNGEFCGTTLCMGGWAHYIKNADLPFTVESLNSTFNAYEIEAQLNMPNDHLFAKYYWPNALNNAYTEAYSKKDYKAMAQVGVEAIYDYIQDPIGFWR